MARKGNPISIIVFLKKMNTLGFRVRRTLTAIFFGRFRGSEGSAIMPTGLNVVVLVILYLSLIFFFRLLCIH